MNFNNNFIYTLGYLIDEGGVEWVAGGWFWMHCVEKKLKTPNIKAYDLISGEGASI